MPSSADDRGTAGSATRVGGKPNRIKVWLTDRETLLFLAAIVVHLIPLWAVRHFPSQDGPAHLGNVAIIRKYFDPDCTAFQAYYNFNRNFTPNWAGHLVLAGLTSFLPLLVAEKVFLSGYVILFPLAVRYAVSAVRRDSAFLAVLAFPFVYNYPLHMGFYSFSYSLAMFFFVSGYWLRHRERFGWRETVTLAGFLLLLYFCHLVSLAAAFLEILLLATWAVLPNLGRQVSQRRFGLHHVRAVLPALNPLVAFVPAAVLAGLFLVQNRQSHLSWEDKPPLRAAVKDLFSLHSLVSYEEREIWVARAVAGLFGGIIAYLILSRRISLRLTLWNGFALLAAFYALVYLAGPSAVSSGSYIHDRMNLFPFLALILWFAAQSYGPRARRSIQVLGLGLAATLLAIRSAKYAELNDYIEEYLSGMPHIEPNTTLLPIAFSQHGDGPDPRPVSLRIDFLLNLAGYIAAERHVVDLGNYEASQTNSFPVMFRPRLNPAEQLRYAPVDSASGEFTAVPTAILSYPLRSGGSVDYVLVWGVRDRDRRARIPKIIFSQLEEGYDLVYTSPERRLVQLYRRRDLTRGRAAEGLAGAASHPGDGCKAEPS